MTPKPAGKKAATMEKVIEAEQRPDKSMLIRAVRYTEKGYEMPPDNNKLKDSDVAILEQWVKMGAPDPRVPTPGAKLTGLTG